MPGLLPANALLLFSFPPHLHRVQDDLRRRRSAALRRRPFLFLLLSSRAVPPRPFLLAVTTARPVLRLAVAAASKERETGRGNRRGRGEEGVKRRKEGRKWGCGRRAAGGLPCRLWGRPRGSWRSPSSASTSPCPSRSPTSSPPTPRPSRSSWASVLMWFIRPKAHALHHQKNCVKGLGRLLGRGSRAEWMVVSRHLYPGNNTDDESISIWMLTCYSGC